MDGKLALNSRMRDCSEHFEGATKLWLPSDEYPSLRLSVLATSLTRTQGKPPKERTFVELLQADNSVNVPDDPVYKEASTQTNNSLVEEELTVAKELTTALREGSLLHWTSVLWRSCKHFTSISNKLNKLDLAFCFGTSQSTISRTVKPG